MTSTDPASKDPVVGELHPAPYNPRTITPEGLESLAASLKEFGDLSGVVKNRRTGHLVGGHQRVRILDKGWAIQKEPVKDSTGTVALGHIVTPWGAFGYREVDWPIEKEMAANISANKHRSDWDNVKLTPLLVQLDAGDFDLSLTGFSDADLKARADYPGHLKDLQDAIPPVPRNPVTKPGDIWKLGRHRVACGDSVDALLVRKLTGGDSVDVLVTDPPYCSGGFQESGKAQGSVGTKSKKYARAGKIHNDTLSTRGYQALMKAVLGNFPAAAAYIFTDWRMWVNLFDVVESRGLGVRNLIVWDKGTPGMGIGWRAQHELVMFAAAKTVKFDNHKAQGNVIQAQRSGNAHHTTEKPVELLEKILGVHPCDTVGDPFLGSGSTLIACEKMGRSCYGVEMSPGYCDVVVERWEAATGEKAKRG